MDAKTPQRVTWLDVAKGIGISLVVAGHISGHSDLPMAKHFQFVTHLYQMPLFFILSGFLFAAKPDLGLIRHKALTLLVPYFTYILAITFIVQGIHILMEGVDLRAHAVALVKAIHGGRYLTGYMGTAWFMSTLFLAQITFNFVIRRKSHGWAVGLLFGGMWLVGTAFALFLPRIHLPMGLTIVPVAVAFLAVGHYMRHNILPQRDVSVLAAFVIIVCTVAAQLGLNFHFDMKNSIFGPPLLGTALALSIAWFVILFYQWVVRFNWVEANVGELGRASLVILCLHQFIHLGLRDIGVNDDLLLLIASMGLPYGLYVLANKNLWSRRILLGQGWR